jgi:hypothetical protein
MKTLQAESDKSEILRRLSTIEPGRRPRWGKMSAHQMVCHLSDALKAFMGIRPVTATSLWYPRAPVRWIALWVPIPWPRGFPARPELDQNIGGTPPGEFSVDLRELCELTNRFTRRPPDFEWRAHPHFGKMGDEDWMRLGYLHADHHLRQFGA